MNKEIFGSKTSSKVRPNTYNAAGGLAHSLQSEEALASLVCTGTLNNSFYTTAEFQFETIKNLLNECDHDFISKVAIYGRKKGQIKDLPCLLVAWLCINSPNSVLVNQTFNVVIDNAKMLSNFVQIIRGGSMGRKSLGSRAKRLVQSWISNRDPERLFSDAVGITPSMKDIILLAHPKASSTTQQAVIDVILGLDKPTKKYLPASIKDYLKWKKDPTQNLPDVPHLLLTSNELTKRQWLQISDNMGWQALRMNLNSLNKHGVFEGTAKINEVAGRIRDNNEISKSKVLPYQIYAAYKHAEGLPTQITNALQDALDISLKNVPSLGKDIAICLDVSGSMASPVTGNRPGAPVSKIRNVDMASIFTAALLKTNENAVIVPFDTSIKNVSVNSRDSLMTITAQLSALLAGGTDCSVALQYLNQTRCKAPIVFMVSDNQSYITTPTAGITQYNATNAQREWAAYKERVKGAKLICINISPYPDSQVPTDKNVLNVGGMTDSVFSIAEKFINHGGNFAQIIKDFKIISRENRD